MPAPVTIFAIPKPFDGEFGPIQRRAIRSWKALGDHIEVLLLGNEDGTQSAADELECRVISALRTNDSGSPILSDAIAQARANTVSRVLVLINADIILLDDFPPALDAVSHQFERFLMVGQRTTLAIENLDMSQSDWRPYLIREARTRGRLDPPTAIDYFAFTRDVFDSVPPFAIGRPPYDHWLVGTALRSRVPVVDATDAVLAVHQKHSYAHVGGLLQAYQGAEADENRRMAGDHTGWADIGFATYRLDESGRVLRAFGMKYLDGQRRLWKRRLITLTRPLRRAWRRSSRSGL